MNTLKDFYYFYKEIPEDKWCTEKFSKPTGECCAFGHLGWTQEVNVTPPNARTIRRLLENNNGVCYLVDVNDGRMSTYPQPTPKQRVLAFLIDKIKEKEDSTFNG